MCVFVCVYTCSMWPSWASHKHSDIRVLELVAAEFQEKEAEAASPITG